MATENPFLDDLKIGTLSEEEQQARRAALEEEQRKLEDLAVSEGLVQYKLRVEEAAAAGQYSVSERGRLSDWLEPLARHLEARCESQRGKPGRPPLWIGVVREVGFEEAAFFTLRGLINSFVVAKGEEDDRRTIAQIALTIGWMVKQQLQARELGERERARVGLRLLGECVEEALPDLVTVRRRFYRKSTAAGGLKTHDTLIPTGETIERIAALDNRLSMLHPVYMPTVIPPRPWQPGQRGGFHYALRDRYPLTKPKHRIPDSAWKQFRERLDKADMPVVYGALNILQSVGWSVNRAVLNLAKDIQQQGESMLAFSSSESVSRMVELLLGTRNGDEEDKQQQWSKRLETKRILGMAERFLDREIYFPMKLDFRGRVYTVPSGLDPQGNDLARGLLTFAPRHARPLGGFGRTYLAQHGVNMLGTDPQTGEKVDKLPFTDRSEWVRDNWKAILDVAHDPFGHPWWAEAEKPFQFYAFCVEMARVIDHERSRRDDKDFEHFYSSFPVAADGSNNGMQHLSAMLRDEEGARRVNLVPSNTAADLYQTIADRVKLECEALAKNGDQAARLWLESGLLDRKLMKRPVMTFGYGVTKQGMVDQICEVVVEQGAAVLGDDGVSMHTAAWFLVEVIWQALEEIVPSAPMMRDWLAAMARAVGKTQPISWTAPTGFPVMQMYYGQKTVSLDTKFGSRRYQPKLAVPTERIDTRKQANSISPNFVHSLDAAVLIRTVATANALSDVTAFGVIHDSFATVPGDMLHLMTALRHEFKKLYTHDDPLEQINQRFHSLCTRGQVDLPQPPERGELDLSQVVESVHFFL